MLDVVWESVRRDFDYWVVKNHDYGIGEEFFDERIWEWCLKVWEKFNRDKRYSLKFVLFRNEKGNGFRRHRDKGSGKAVVVVVFSGVLKLWVEGEIFEIKKRSCFYFEGNKIHGVEKGGEAEYLILFSGKL